MRSANEIDFWRGLALVSIFINHIPGFAFERFSHRNFGLSDSAELFVFLAGWALRRLADHSGEPVGLVRLMLRLEARGVTLYAAQILITMLALGLISAAAMLLDNPLLLEWHNASAVFSDPVPTHLGLVLLTHQLGFFDILPLYVVLMLCAPVIALIHRFSPQALVPLSLALYAVALTYAIDLPTWPVEGVWYFNPLAWQLIFVLGFTFAGSAGLGGVVRRHLRLIRPVAIVVVVASAFVVLSDYQPDALRVPKPTLFFVFDKSYLSPARLLHFLALASAFAGGFSIVLRFARPLARFLSMLGRNSLNVFCVGSLLSLSGQLARFAFGGSRVVDLCILVVGVSALGFTGWLSELRERLRNSAAA